MLFQTGLSKLANKMDLLKEEWSITIVHANLFKSIGTFLNLDERLRNQRFLIYQILFLFQTRRSPFETSDLASREPHKFQVELLTSQSALIIFHSDMVVQTAQDIFWDVYCLLWYNFTIHWAGENWFCLYWRAIINSTSCSTLYNVFDTFISFNCGWKKIRQLVMNCSITTTSGMWIVNVKIAGWWNTKRIIIPPDLYQALCLQLLFRVRR